VHIACEGMNSHEDQVHVPTRCILDMVVHEMHRKLTSRVHEYIFTMHARIGCTSDLTSTLQGNAESDEETSLQHKGHSTNMYHVL
jgi:hypothetical protein